MADIFISYANEDRERASKLASLLEARGWSVWWDRKIIAGQSFDQEIEHQLETAKSVIALWSNNSIASEWVKNEAAVAAERGVLVPAMIDNVKLPLEFRRKQTADLVDWDGDPSHEGYQALCEGVAALTATPAGVVPLQATVRPGTSRRWNRRWTLGALVLVVVVLGFGVYWGLINTRTNISKEVRKVADLADLVTGTYYGAVISDSKGSSRSDVTVTITKINKRRVRIASDYERLGTVEADLTRVGNTIQSADGKVGLLLEMEKNLPHLSYNPNGEVAYDGQKQ
jgi:hypothetical protein